MITGGAGFIGSNVVNMLYQHYDNVKLVVLDRLDYCSRMKNWDPVMVKDNSRFAFVQGDIASEALVLKSLQEHKVDTVMHFAAQTHVDNSFDGSLEFSQDNILGTHHLLHVCHLYGGIRRFIHVSTDEVYGEVPFDQIEGCLETTALSPTNPYAATKAAAEHIARSYMISYGIPIIITRGNNVYGQGQYPEKLIPKFSLMLMRGQKVTIHGKGQSRRNFIHVDDTATAFIIILERGKDGETYNIGTNNELSVLEVVDRLVPLIHGDNIIRDEVVTFVKDRNFNDCRYHLDSCKLRELGWKETIPFDEGLHRTVQWYLERKDEFPPV